MRIHQLLHGYSDGHGRLAGSILDIAPKDAARIAQMSDWSGYKDPRGKDHSYLTAYPLEDSHYYVVAKSWYASEMERPGCVWTHSLLIDSNQKSGFVDFRTLERYFHRPTRGDYGSYNKPIEAEEQGNIEWEGWKPDSISLMFMLTTLLTGNETFCLKVEQESEWNQRLCLTYLQFLPLAMLKRISMSSGAPSPRKMGGESLSMQFVTTAGGISLLSPPWKEKLNDNDFSSGLHFVVKGMIGEEKGEDVSSLIKVFSQDIGSDGNKYIGVALLLEMLHMKVNDTAFVSYRDVLGTIVNYFPQRNEGNVVKLNYLGQRISSLFCKSESEFVFIISTWKDAELHFSGQQMSFWTRVTIIVESDEGGYLELVKELAFADLNAFGKQIVTESLDRLPIGNYEMIPDNLWERLLPYLGENNQYLVSDKWFGIEGNRFNDVLWAFQQTEVAEYSHWEKLLLAVMQKQAYMEGSFVDRIYQNTTNCSWQVLDFLNTLEKETRHGYIYTRAFKDCPNFVKWLSKQEHVSGCVGEMVVNYIDPRHECVKRSSPAIWRWIIKSQNGHKNIDTYIYILSLAYNWRGQDALDFFYHSFAKVHDALGESQTSDLVWQYVSRYGGKVHFYQEWDRCRKLRNGVVAHLKSLGFNKRVLNNFTPDMELNNILVGIFDKI